MAYPMQQQQNFNPVQFNTPSTGNALSSFFFGSPQQTATTQRFNPQQQGLQSDVLGRLQQILSGGAPIGYESIANQARENFQKKTIPSLAERFSSMGGSPGGSSGFAGLLGEAGTGLESNLAALQGQLSQQQLSSYLPHALSQAFNSDIVQRQPGFLENILFALLNAGGQIGGQVGGAKLASLI